MNLQKLLQFASGPIVAALLSFAIVPMSTWLFEPESIGRIAMFQVAISFSVLFFSLGMDHSFARFFHEKDNPDSYFLEAMLPGIALITLFIVLIAFIDLTSISRLLFSTDNALVSWLIVVSMFMALLTRYLTIAIRMQERGLAFSIVQILPKVVVISMLGLVAMQFYSNEFTGLISIYAISLSLPLLMLFFLNRHLISSSLKQRFDRQRLNELFSFGLPLMLSGFALWAFISVDRILLKGLSSLDELAIYSVALSLGAVGHLFANVFNTVWVPVVYKWFSSGKDVERVDLVFDILLLAVVCFYGVVALLSPLAQYLFPQSYSSVTYIFLCCLAYPLFSVLGETAAINIHISGKNKLVLYASLIALVVNIIFGLWLIPAYGAGGAAIATVLGAMALLVARVEFSSRAYRQLERLKLYSYCLLCAGFSIGMILVDSNYWLLLWGVLLFSTIIFMRKNWSQGYMFMKRIRTGDVFG